MSRTGGDLTRKRILSIAEKLFSEKGFDATSVASIAKKARVNKALIYYHFKNKDDIVFSLFHSIIEDLTHRIGNSIEDFHKAGKLTVEEKIKKEIMLLSDRKDILSVLLMEALKAKNKNFKLFEVANLVIENEKKSVLAKLKNQKSKKKLNELYIHEFFTGVLPIIMFIALKDKWSSYYKINPDETLKAFINSFINSHIRSHIE
jgi:AcrR family transcriptional regulator